MPLSILVVDDESVLAEGLALFLLDEGHRVRVARDGEEALDLQAEEPADVIVSDVMMPRLDGYGLVRSLRAGNDQTPVVLMSAAGMPRSRWEHVRVLAKPFDLDDILTAIAAVQPAP